MTMAMHPNDMRPMTEMTGRVVFLIGERLRGHLSRLLGDYLNDRRVERVILLTATPSAAAQIAAPFAEQREQGRLATVLAGDDFESAVAAARRGWGEPDLIVRTPVTSEEE